MGARFMIDCASYPFKGYWEDCCYTNSITEALRFFFMAKRKYEIIDIKIRDIKEA